MTTVRRSFRHPQPAEVAGGAVIDVRCSAGLPDRGPAEGRCQLFAGHDGPHAVMYARGNERLVRTWRSNGRPTESDALHLPWMFGYPVPAWSEKVAPTELTG